MIRNILWDVDGVLFDTHPAITYALSRSLNGMGLTVAMNEIDGLVQKSLDVCIATLSRRFRLDPDLLRLRFAESYLAVPPANQPPFPGVRETCRLIQERGGRNVIVTHRRVESVQQLLKAHALEKMFTGIYSAGQGDPDNTGTVMLEAAIQHFALKRMETLAVGCRAVDIQAGRAAGVHTCLFGDIQISVPADLQILCYSQLFAWLAEQNQHERKDR